MPALLETLSQIHRPRLLIRAARHGLEEYNRNRDLKRVLRGEDVPEPGETLPRLMQIEEAHEAIRQRGDASYSIAKHLEVLIALMAEARLIGGRRSQA